jgi:hypothetical protein
VVDSKNTTEASADVLEGSHSTVSSVPGLVFFDCIGVKNTSSAPPSNSRSIRYSKFSGFISSMEVFMTVISSAA